MNEFKVGDCLYNPKRDSKYIVVDINEYNKAMGQLLGGLNCFYDNLDGNKFIPLRALTPVKGFHWQGAYIVIPRERINNPDYSSDLDSTYEKIEI